MTSEKNKKPSNAEAKRGNPVLFARLLIKGFLAILPNEIAS